jgi:hypothetical protein
MTQILYAHVNKRKKKMQERRACKKINCHKDKKIKLKIYIICMNENSIMKDIIKYKKVARGIIKNNRGCEHGQNTLYAYVEISQ